MTPRLTILLPAYNEADNIATAVRSNDATGRALNIPFEIVAVNDGSGDDTAARLEEMTRETPNLRVVTHPQNRGFGAALRTALQNARGEFCIVAPADSPFSAATLQPFLDIAGEADLVLGYRVAKPGYSWLMRFNSRLYHWLLRLVCGLPYKDVNWIHLYRRKLFESIDLEFAGIAMGAEVVLKAHALGFRIREVACPMQQRTKGQASARRFSVMARTGRDLLLLLWRWRMVGLYRRPGKGLLARDQQRIPA